MLFRSARGTNGDFTAGTITATAFTTTGSISATGVSGNISAGGTITATGNVTGASIIKSGGTSSQFLKADGSVDSNVYLTSVGNGTLTLATSGTGISLGATTTFTADQSTNSTITISSNATSSGTTSGTIVARGTNGDFTAGSITATQFIKSGGTAAQFLKADGSIDSNTYLTGSGTSTQVAFYNNSNALTSSSNFYWDNTNLRLGIQTNAPGTPLDIHNGTAGTTTISVNNTASSNAYIAFQKNNTGYWRIGNTATANSFDILNNTLANTAFTINNANNAVTINASQTYSSGSAFSINPNAKIGRAHV